MNKTNAAKAEKPKRVSRSRLRYLQYLRADMNCTFGEWLKNKWYLPPDPEANRRRYAGEYP